MGEQLKMNDAKWNEGMNESKWMNEKKSAGQAERESSQDRALESLWTDAWHCKDRMQAEVWRERNMQVGRQCQSVFAPKDSFVGRHDW